MNRRHLAATVICYALVVASSFAQSKTPGDAMVELKGSATAWMRQCERAFALFMGVPEQKLKAHVPGFDWPPLPPELAPLMSGDPAALDYLMPLFEDKRPTHVKNDDMLGNPDDESFLTVSDLARSLVVWLMPMGPPEDSASKSGTEVSWPQRAAALKPEERLAEWFQGAADEQRRMALAFFIATDHPGAWRVIEKSLLARAKAGKEVVHVIMEAAAYVRHRKHEAAPFLGKFAAALKPGQISEEYGYLFAAKDGRFMLVESYTAAERVQQFVDGGLTLDDLAEWIMRGMDQPWAYHSMGIEPASVHLRHVDHCLEAVLAGAAKTHDRGKRLSLLEFAEALAEARNDVFRHSRKDERYPPAAPMQDSQLGLVAALEELLKDRREEFVSERLVSPAHLAAQCVWDRWGTNTRYLDSVFHGAVADWRGQARHFPRGLPDLSMEAAVDLLNRTEAMKPGPFPEAEARGLAADLMKLNNEDWQARLRALSWEQKLMLCEQALKDDAFAHRAWMGMRRWGGVQVSEDTPPSLQTLWKSSLQGKSLDAAALGVLKKWIMEEVQAGRHWAIVAESFAGSGGLTLHLYPVPNVKPSAYTRLRFVLEGTSLAFLREWARFDGSKWESSAPPSNAFEGPGMAAVLDDLDKYFPMSQDKQSNVGLFRLVMAVVDGFD